MPMHRHRRVRVTPTHIIIGRDGRIQYVGHLANKELDAALIAARAPAPANRMPPPSALQAPVRSAIHCRKCRCEPSMGSASNFGTAANLTVLMFLSPWCKLPRDDAAAGVRELPQRPRAVRSRRTRVCGWLGIASGLWANSEDLRKYRAQYKVERAPHSGRIG